MTTVPQVQIAARDYYVLTKGVPLGAAIALVSVLYYESKLSPGSQGYQTTETPGVLNPHGAYGIASWNGPRQQGLLDFATARSLKADVLETQLAFVLTEIANGYPNCWAALRSTASYQGVISVLVDEYENPKDKPAEISGALKIAGPLAALPPPQLASQVAVPQAPAVQVPIPATPTPAPSAGLPPISATSAGRRAAEQAYIAAMLDQLAAERVAIDEEIAAFQEMGANLGKLNPAPTTQLISKPITPRPPVSELPPAPQEGTTTMPAIFTNILTSWATSVLGTMAGSPAVIDVIQHPANWQADIPGIATVLLGLVAKDGWVTGGTKQAPTSK